MSFRTHHAKTTQNGDESPRSIHEPPRIDQIANKTHDETSTRDINPSRGECRKIHTTGDRVLDQVRCKLRNEETHPGEETTCTSRGVVVIFQQVLQDRDGIPDEASVHVVDGACSKGAKRGTNGHRYRTRNELMYDGCPARFGEASPVGLTNASSSPRACDR